MNSTINARFRKMFARLPTEVQMQARAAYRQFMNNPHHPSLHFKRVHPSQPIYSIRINRDYRALGERDGDNITWVWIGPHDAYDKQISQL